MIIDKFKSRYGETRYVTEQPDGSYIVEGNTGFHRVSMHEGGKPIMFDFEGGPFIMVGETALEFNVKAKVKSIEILESIDGYAKVKVFCE